MKTTRTRLILLTTLLSTGCAPLQQVPTPSHPTSALMDTDPPVTITELAALPPAGSGHSLNDLATAAEPDLWEKIRNGFRLTEPSRSAVTDRINRYSRNPQQVEHLFARAKPYLAYIANEIHQRNFPTEIVLLPFVESGYDPFAYSQGRAAGLWQFIPATGKMYDLQQDWWVDDRRNIIKSTAAALDHLDRLQQSFKGDWLLALAAYNAGGGTVRKAISRNRKAGKPTDFWHLKLPTETMAYIPKLLAISAIVKDPGKYNVTLAPVETTPAFALVDIQGQLDIGVAAELASISTEQLYLLNPGFNRWATHPDGPHQLVIPVGKTTLFEKNLHALTDAQRVNWIRHRIRRGETLSHIARRYETTIAVLQNTNELTGTGIRTGQHLLVPVAARDPSKYAALSGKLHPASKTKNRISYRVRKGDSLWAIARQHQVTVAQVTRWNRLDSGALIKPGQKLILWQTGKQPGGNKRVRPVSYTVRSGDSLYRIARKFNVSIADLRRWNKLSGKKYLQPGQHLKLYVDVTRLTRSNRS